MKALKKSDLLKKDHHLFIFIFLSRFFFCCFCFGGGTLLGNLTGLVRNCPKDLWEEGLSPCARRQYGSDMGPATLMAILGGHGQAWLVARSTAVCASSLGSLPIALFH